MDNMQLLFVEDDILIRDLIVEFLQEHGFEVIEACTAEDAMCRMLDAPAPLLVVTDIHLGTGRSGIEFADWLHERWPELKVIFASGRLDWLRGRALDQRETCLAKPFRLSKLVDLVHSIVSHSGTARGI